MYMMRYLRNICDKLNSKTEKEAKNKEESNEKNIRLPLDDLEERDEYISVISRLNQSKINHAFPLDNRMSNQDPTSPMKTSSDAEKSTTVLSIWVPQPQCVELLNKIWNTLDDNEDGYINMDDFNSINKKYNNKLSTFQKAYFRSLIQEFDINDNGIIDGNEFKASMFNMANEFAFRDECIQELLHTFLSLKKIEIELFVQYNQYKPIHDEEDDDLDLVDDDLAKFDGGLKNSYNSSIVFCDERIEVLLKITNNEIGKVKDLLKSKTVGTGRKETVPFPITFKITNTGNFKKNF